MNAVEAVALSKFKLNGERDQVEPGEYDINMIVRVRGSVKVGEDYEQNVVASAEPWALLAVALSKLNGTTISSIVREAENGGIDSEAVKREANAAIQTIKEKTKRPMKGKVTSKLTFAGAF